MPHFYLTLHFGRRIWRVGSFWQVVQVESRRKRSELDPDDPTSDRAEASDGCPLDSGPIRKLRIKMLYTDRWPIL